MWVHAQSMAGRLCERLGELLDELRTAPGTTTASAVHQLPDTDFVASGQLTVTRTGPTSVAVTATARFEVYRPGPAGPRLVVLSPWYGGHDTAWLICRQARGEGLQAVPDGARFVLPLDGVRPPDHGPDAFGLRAQRCGCRPAGGSSCGSAPDLVRVVDRDGEGVFGCDSHSIDVLRRLAGGRAEPGVTAGYSPDALAAAAEQVQQSADHRAAENEPGHRRLAGALGRGTGRWGEGPPERAPARP